MKKEQKKLDNDIQNTYKPFVDASGLGNSSNKAAFVSLSSHLKGIVSSTHSNITDPERSSDYAWLLKKVLYSILTIGSVLLIATFIQYYFQ